MAQGDLAPEMMSSTKLSTVSAQRGRNGKGVRSYDGQAMRSRHRQRTAVPVSGQRQAFVVAVHFKERTLEEAVDSSPHCKAVRVSERVFTPN